MTLIEPVALAELVEPVELAELVEFDLLVVVEADVVAEQLSIDSLHVQVWPND